MFNDPFKDLESLRNEFDRIATSAASRYDQGVGAAAKATCFAQAREFRRYATTLEAALKRIGDLQNKTPGPGSAT